MKTKAFLMIALLCMVAQGAWAQTTVKTESELRNAISQGINTIKLMADITLERYVDITDGKTVKLDLNGYTLGRNDTESSGGGRVILVKEGGTLTVKDSSSDGSGTITGGRATKGGGICNYGTLTLEGGTIMSCEATEQGGGIYNGASTEGGTAATFTMTGGSISDCSAADCGGIYNAEDGTLYIKGGTISDCSSDRGGGGVVNYGTATISGGTITGNYATTRGGGVWNGESATLTITGGTITSNRADKYGSGVFSYSSFSMSGNPKVKDNEGTNNLYLVGSDTKITCGTFTDGASIGVSLENGKYNRAITSGFGSNNSGAQPSDFFSADLDGATLSLQDNEAYIAASGYLYVERSWEGGDTDGHIVKTTKLCSTYSDYSDTEDLYDGWYVFTGSNTYSTRPRCHGDVKFILQDGCNVEFEKGIHIDKDKTLTIYAQSGGTGKLRCTGDDGWASHGDAAIGGNNKVVGGNLVIHGGDIYAYPYHNCAAGIGGGNGEASGMQSITIWDGTIEAKGRSDGAGIGGGENNDTKPTITIYGGDITATGGKNAAGIGGGAYRGSGTIKIYGGTINATSGKDGAGIGSGYDTDLKASIYIYNGTVNATAKSAWGSAIGGKDFGDYGVYIYGGTITADASDGGSAGIGSFYGGNCGTIEIHGGTVYAYAASESAAIGGGAAKCTNNGAGTAPKFNSDDNASSSSPRSNLRSMKEYEYEGGEGGTVSIYDGYVEAYGGSKASAIGSGYQANAGGNVCIYGGTVKVKITGGADDGDSETDIDESNYLCWGSTYQSFKGVSFGVDNAAPRRSNTTYSSRLTLADDLMVSKGDDTVSYDERGNTCLSHPDDESVILTITACTHSSDPTYTIKDNDKHTVSCSYCKGYEEAHNTDGENGSCTKCGIGSTVYEITLYEAKTDGSGYDDGTIYEVGSGVTFTLPKNSTVEGKTLVGWKETTTAPDGIEAEDSELSSLTSAGSSFQVSESATYYARYQTCWEGDGTGTSEDPYLVKSADDWEYIANKVKGGRIHYDGKYFKMTEDISVTTKIGEYNSSSKYFAGNFNGNYKTLTVSITGNSTQGVGPFASVKGVTIKNLYIDGTVTTNRNYGGGLVGFIFGGTNYINNCRCSVALNGNNEYFGGFVGRLDAGTVNFTRCVYDGKLKGDDNRCCGGFVGSNPNTTVKLINCLFAPQSVTGINTGYSGTFTRDDEHTTITNCYYTQTCGSTQGTQAYTVESGNSDLYLYYGEISNDDDEVDLQITSSNNIVVFDTGLLFQDKLYTGGTTEVTFTLATTDNKSISNVTASAGTLVRNEDKSYTLTMASQDAVINAEVSEVETVTLTDGEENSETLEENDGQTVNVEYDRELSAEETTEASARRAGAWKSVAYTVCLPYKIKVNEKADNYVAKVFKLVAVDHDSKQFVFIEADNTIVAGTPVVIVVYEGRVSLNAKRVKLIATLPADGLANAVYPTYADYLAHGENNLGYWKGSFNTFRAFFQAIETKDMANYKLMYQPQDGDMQPFPADIFADNFPDEDPATGITTTDFTDSTDKAGAWYDLQGRRFNSKPTAKGVYINNGYKRVIK